MAPAFSDAKDRCSPSAGADTGIIGPRVSWRERIGHSSATSRLRLGEIHAASETMWEIEDTKRPAGYRVP
jgi:hypothetical protein